MRFIMALCCAVLTLFGTTACTTVQHATASGRPEVTVNAPADAVRVAFINGFIDRGYTIIEDTPYRLVMDRRSDNVMANVLLGSQWNPQIHARISLTVATLNSKTRVVADLNAVTNPGTAFERLTPMSNSKDSEEIQQFMRGIAAQVEGASAGGSDAVPSETLSPTEPNVTLPATPVAVAPKISLAAAAPQAAPVGVRSVDLSVASATPARTFVSSAADAFVNCTAARAAGAAPVMRGEPGYGYHLDRDNDGIGCE
jgi:hypothetical protein